MISSWKAFSLFSGGCRLSKSSKYLLVQHQLALFQHSLRFGLDIMRAYPIEIIFFLIVMKII